MTTYPEARLRVYFDAETMLGPGKADLLQNIHETGSISAAGRRMGMSYRRAWTLVDTLNHYFREPLVVSSAGGRSGGGATLTPTGIEVLARYRHMQTVTEGAIAADLAALSGLLGSRS
ncbi:winged helix-turn-helix domain-containing protein [Microvirga pudoricolor]|uniref:winged helix-turn-helix domain-containing protein n=1 Tax=Microvirga pudoricolor TaxID=2778729 RepID=UPI0019523316|nr:LysR family transcriptional regulator [Microvirga pudoricolor]MBM6595228.1 LysR family transcriptional regulator [Microvirga pudoricolor]